MKEINFYNYPKLELELLKNCNFKCKYCAEFSPSYKIKNEMDFDYLKKIIIYLRKEAKKTKQSLPNIILSGGEPSLYSHINDLIFLLKDFNVFIITNFSTPFFNQLIDKNFIYNFNTIFSVHLDYIDLYLKKDFIKKIQSILDRNNFFQFQLVLPQFNKLDSDTKNKIKKFIKKYKKFSNNCFIHYQFIIDENKSIYEKIENINIENLKKWEAFLEPFTFKPFFFGKDYHQTYLENLNYYLNNNFSFKNQLCYNNNYRLNTNFDLVLECSEKIRLGNIKKNIKISKKVLNLYKIKCPLDICCFQSTGYCDKQRINK